MRETPGDYEVLYWLILVKSVRAALIFCLDSLRCNYYMLKEFIFVAFENNIMRSAEKLKKDILNEPILSL